MKKLIPAFFILLVLSACKKSNVTPYASQGTLTGYDLGACPMCGGIEVVIKNDTTKNAPPFYRINETLTQLGIDANAKFPINVSLNWQHQEGTTYIKVTAIKMDN
ncbi:MAG TPA: hypothetical protein VGM63_15650 [Mucilaginibacter sp.]